jgi:hypothetical protein
MTDTCKTCKFYKVEREESFCLRRSPQLVTSSVGRTRTEWPHVFDYQWCGEWEAPKPHKTRTRKETVETSAAPSAKAGR